VKNRGVERKKKVLGVSYVNAKSTRSRGMKKEGVFVQSLMGEGGRKKRRKVPSFSGEKRVTSCRKTPLPNWIGK